MWRHLGTGNDILAADLQLGEMPPGNPCIGTSVNRSENVVYTARRNEGNAISEAINEVDKMNATLCAYVSQHIDACRQGGQRLVE